MKKTNRAITLLLALFLMLGFTLAALTSCGDEEGNVCQTCVDSDKDGKCDECGSDVKKACTTCVDSNKDGKCDECGNKVVSKKIDYTVTVKTVGGMAIEGAVVTVFEDETLENLEAYATTDANGKATVKLYEADGYAIKISGAPEGYIIEDYYTFTGNKKDIVLTSEVINNPSLSGVTYKLGDIMRDFTVTASDGKVVTLSALLKEKDAVLINFWYTTCSWCIEEFPFMESAYQTYKEDIAIVALNPYTSDSIEAIRLFKDQYGLSFDVARDVGLSTAFGVNAYPTSVMVDKYGTICLIVNGAITGEKYFNVIFDHFTAENYEQKLINNYEELAPAEKPNLDMPSSEEIGNAINSGDIEITYYPEEGTEDTEYSWPFVLDEKDGVKFIKASNAKKDSSFATIHADVVLRAGEALAFDYFSSTEKGSDLLYVLVDGVNINTISGISDDWDTCFPYVAEKDATYKLTLIYLKDSSTDVEEDTVYINNVRVVNAADISNATYIPHWAATNPNSNGLGFQNYADVVLGSDGYYHVGSDTGPLLLANMMGVTPFSENDSVFSIISNAYSMSSGLAQYYNTVVKYCNYASNAKINGLCTVNEDLARHLQIIAESEGFEIDNPKQWLQFCLYYKAYGTNGVELEDPIIGLAPHSAYPTVVNAEFGLEEYPNEVVYDRVIMPRGLWYAFTPSVSGAYRIVSNVNKDDNSSSLAGWIFLEDGSLYYEHVISERLLDDGNNVRMYAYFEAGTTYYIDIAYEDLYKFDSFGFKIEYLGESYSLFRTVSPGAPFTYELDANGEVTNLLIAGGVKVKLNEEDGYYYNILPDGTMGTSRIYVDFTMFTSIFSYNSLEKMIEQGAFDFSKSEGDHYARFTDEELRTLWGPDFEANYEYHKIAEVRAGIYHGEGEDMTAKITEYCNSMITDGDMEVRGCVEVNAELAEILQMLMDKYTFKDVENSWVKLCYYYEYIGEGWEWVSTIR